MRLKVTWELCRKDNFKLVVASSCQEPPSEEKPKGQRLMKRLA